MYHLKVAAIILLAYTFRIQSTGSGREFVVETLTSIGGKITSDGVNNFVSDKVNAKDVEDYQKTSGFSACGNVKDFKQDTQTNQLLLPDKQSALITTTNLNFNNSDYAAKNHTTIHGAGGTHLDVEETSGKVITDKSDDKEFTKIVLILIMLSFLI